MNRTTIRFLRFPFVFLLLLSVVLADTPLKPLPKFLRSKRLAERYLRTRDIEDILKFERAEPVCDQLLTRENVESRYRIEALESLAKIKGNDPVDELLSRAESAELNAAVLVDLVELLPQLPLQHLQKHKARLTQAAEKSEIPTFRQAAIVGQMVADQSVDAVWAAGENNEEIRIDTLAGIRLLPDKNLRSIIAPKVLPILRNDDSEQLQLAAVKSVRYLAGDRKEFFIAIADLIHNDKHVDAGVSALIQLGSENFVESKAESLVTDVLAYLEAMPIGQRAEESGQNCVRLLESISMQLSNTSRQRVTAKLNRLSVLAIRVTALPEKMAYDETVLVVDAGRPIRITFFNDDIMPHNLVIGSDPNARVELGLMSDEMQNDKDALAKGYLPDSDMVLFASKMIQPGQESIIDFVMPDEGVYPFVCTFPGHWSKMYGALKVVASSKEFLAANAALPSADELLGIRKVDWKFDELAADISQVDSGRSFESGKRWFKQGSCYSCHRMRGEGGLVGPDLSEITKKHKTAKDVLAHIMQPSKEIEEKFSAITVIDSDGRIHQGMVLKRTDEELFLQTNPLAADCTPTVIRIDEIEDESKSKISAMPEKLLNTIVEKSAVYDLIAYVMSGGVETDSRFAK